MMKPIKIAQIGINRHSHARQVFKSLATLPDFELVGFALVEDEREAFADCLSAYNGYPELSLDEILNDPTIEAVTIETEEKHLTKYAQLAADRGKMIHMEKPGGESFTAFERLIATVKQKNLVFHTGYMYRYNPFVIEAIEKVRRGELGEIVSVEAQMNCRHKDDVREWLSGYRGGMMFFLGCHLIDLILQIAGTPTRVIPLNRASGMNGIDSLDCGMAVLEYPNGVSFAKTYDVEYGGFLRRQLVITGTKGSIELQPLEETVKDTLILSRKIEQTAENASHWSSPRIATASEPFERYSTMMEGFARIARGETQNPYTPDYELQLFSLLLKACGIEKDR